MEMTLQHADIKGLKIMYLASVKLGLEVRFRPVRLQSGHPSV